jgi:hypothetical protein
MGITQLIDDGLQYLTKRRDNMVKKPRYPPVGGAKTKSGANGAAVCGACGGEIVEVNTTSHRRACFKCGKEAQ